MDIRGSFTVRKKSVLTSNIDYKILFLDDRLLFVKIGDQIILLIGLFIFIAVVVSFTMIFGIIGALVAGFIGGGLWGLIIALLSKNQQKKADHLISNISSYPSAEDVIRADKKNFSIPFSEISDIQVQQTTTGLHGILFISTDKNYKFDIIDQKPLTELEVFVSSIRHH
jgi:hypothetical protein